MNLELQRKEFYEDCTIGGFYIDGKFEYFSLEDKDRHLEDGGTKIPKETAIPKGRYKVVLGWSGKRKGLVPFLLNVPQFEAIEIHIANNASDVEGCIGIGKGHNAKDHMIFNSTIACEEFYPKLLQGIIDSKNDVWIEVS